MFFSYSIVSERPAWHCFAFFPFCKVILVNIHSQLFKMVHIIRGHVNDENMLRGWNRFGLLKTRAYVKKICRNRRNDTGGRWYKNGIGMRIIEKSEKSDRTVFG